MYLIGVQDKAPDRSVAGDTRGLHGLVRARFRQEVPEGTGIPSPAWFGQLYFGEQPVTAGTVFHHQFPLD